MIMKLKSKKYYIIYKLINSNIYNSDLVSLHKKIERDEKEILDKEFYKKKYQKFLEEKENNIDKDKTGFSKTYEKREQQSDEFGKGKKNAQMKLGAKGIVDNKKKQRKIKDKYECKKIILFFLIQYLKIFQWIT